MSANNKGKTVAELAAYAGGRVVGDGNSPITSVATLEGATTGEVAFVENEKFLDVAKNTRASCLIVPEEADSDLLGATSALIKAKNPKLAFALVSELLHPRKQVEPAIHPTAIIAASADVDPTVFIGAHACVGEDTRIAAGTQIHAGASIGEGVRVGRDCILYANAVLYDNVSVGDRVTLHAGVVVGADGFGFVRGDLSHHKFPQIGTVVIEDEVELGANTCVDRAALGRTRIGRGTKIDNLVHVGHNVDIGERVVIAAQTGISGSVVIEDDVIIGGQVGFGDHIRVQSGAVIGSKAGILPGKIVRPGVWWGIPIQPLDKYKRLNAHLSRLPQMRKEIKELRERIKELLSIE